MIHFLAVATAVQGAAMIAAAAAAVAVLLTRDPRVIAAGALAEAVRWLRPGKGADALEVADREPGRRLQLALYALAGFVGIYALQATYSAALEVALKNVCLF